MSLELFVNLTHSLDYEDVFFMQQVLTTYSTATTGHRSCQVRNFDSTKPLQLSLERINSYLL